MKESTCIEDKDSTTNKCQRHLDEDLCMFCRPCRILICPRCIKDHNNHDVYHRSQIGEITALYYSTLQSVISSNKILENYKDKFEKLIFEYKSKVEENDHYFDRMMAQLFTIIKVKIMSQIEEPLCIKPVLESIDYLSKQHHSNCNYINNLKARVCYLENLINHQEHDGINSNNEQSTNPPVNSSEYLQYENKYSEYLNNYQNSSSKIKEFQTKTKKFVKEIIQFIKNYEFLANKEQENGLNIGQCSSIIYFDYDNDEDYLYICDLKNFTLKKAHTTLSLAQFATFCQSQETLYIIGGIDKISKKELDTHFKYENKIVSKLSHMLSNKRDFSAISKQSDSIIIAGGMKNKNVISECEEYIIDEDKWIALHFLNERKHFASLCLIGEWLYSVGGIFGDFGVKGNKIEAPITNYFERLNLKLNNQRWEICKPIFLNSEISLKGLILSYSFPINKNEMIIFGGSDLEIGEKKQILTYNVKFNEISKMNIELQKEDTFNQVTSQPIYYKKVIYNVGLKNDLHSLSLVTHEVKIIPFVEWSENGDIDA